jgi:hypothetical protein
MKNVSKVLRVLELIWLSIGFIGLGSFIYMMIQGRRSEAIYFLIITFAGGLMYIVRSRQRKRTEAGTKDK